MTKLSMVMTLAVGAAAAIPSVAHAHGTYLQAISDTVEELTSTPACELPGMTCGLCHEPSKGERNENIRIMFGEFDPTIRNGPFYESLLAQGWDHEMNNGKDYQELNAALLADTAIPNMLANMVDSDGDGVIDVEELELGYNPLLAYEEADPERSQLCDNAADFPMEIGDSSSSGEATTDGGDTTGGEATTGGDEATTGGEETDDEGPATTEPGGGDGATTTGDPTGDTGATAGGNDDDSGCRIGGSGYDRSALGLLLMMGLVARRRRNG